MRVAPRQDGLRVGVSGFTLIEMLTVIAIIILVMAMALPNFVAMLQQQRWRAAAGNIQYMIWRARALATNVRKDFSVEFDIQGDSGTWMWLESEMNTLERLPDLDDLQDHMGSRYTFYYGILSPMWYPSGGTCSQDGGRYTNFQIDYANSKAHQYGDNARQSEIVEVGHGLTVDDGPGMSRNFFNWDGPTSVKNYGEDSHRDIRIGTNGSLMQSRSPVICLREKEGTNVRRIEVNRVTGRILPVN